MFNEYQSDVFCRGSKAYISVLENKYLNATYNWLAPEILAGQQPNEKSDLYGLCAVLWECVNGLYRKIIGINTCVAFLLCGGKFSNQL